MCIEKLLYTQHANCDALRLQADELLWSNEVEPAADNADSVKLTRTSFRPIARPKLWDGRVLTHIESLLVAIASGQSDFSADDRPVCSRGDPVECTTRIRRLLSLLADLKSAGVTSTCCFGQLLRSH